MDSWEVVLVIGLAAGFLIGGFVVNLFAHQKSWWRWWYTPLMAGIPGAILCLWAAVQPSEVSLFAAAFLFPFVVLIPMVLAAIGMVGAWALTRGG